MLKRVIQIYENSIYPEKLKYYTLDFEPALHSAFKEIFPSINIIGCLFHYSQALEIYAKKLHLNTTDPEVQHLIVKMKNLCWVDLKQNDLINIKDDLYKTILNKKGEFKKYVDYFISEWIPFITKGVLNFNEIEQQHRSNSAIESYMSKLKKNIPLNVDFIGFLNYLKQEENDACKKLYFCERR